MKLEQSSISIHAHNMGSLHSNSAMKMDENIIIITPTLHTILAPNLKYRLYYISSEISQK